MASNYDTTAPCESSRTTSSYVTRALCVRPIGNLSAVTLNHDLSCTWRNFNGYILQRFKTVVISQHAQNLRALETRTPPLARTPYTPRAQLPLLAHPMICDDFKLTKYLSPVVHTTKSPKLTENYAIVAKCATHLRRSVQKDYNLWPITHTSTETSKKTWI